MKRILSICLCLLLLLSVAAPAWAENQSRTVIGADLSPEQVEAVYQSFGLRRGDVVELTMTNAEERRYLEGLVDERVIGSRSISCVYVELLPEGSGLSIATNNVTWWTEEMYISALTTAGIKDARIIVSAPFEVSGTSALSGIYKAYEDMTGLSLDELAKQVSTEELTITGDLAQQIGNMDSTSIVSELKLVLNETKNMSDDEIRAIITEIAGRYNVHLTDTQINQLISLCRSLENLNPDQLRQRVEEVQGTLQKMAEAKTKVESFAQDVKNVMESVSGFIDKLRDFLGKFS